MMKNRFRRRMIYRPQALHATQVMDTVHQQNLTPPRSGTECFDLRGPSHGSIPPTRPDRTAAMCALARAGVSHRT
jgi:hypothetical protein